MSFFKPSGDSEATGGGGAGIASWRPYTTPPDFTGTNLNGPVAASVTEPYPMRTLSVVYTGAAQDRLFYEELAAISGASWTIRGRARGLSSGVGFAAFGFGVRFGNGIYCSANIIRNNLNTSFVPGIVRYAAGTGVQADTRNQNGTSGDAWAFGRWFLLSWNAASNIAGEGVGELSLTTGVDGYNYDPVILRLGNLGVLGGGTNPVGVGAALAPYSPITANYTLEMAVESYEQIA